MWQGGYLQRGDLGKGFWRPKKVHWMMEGLLLTKAGCCGSKVASRICKRPSLLTIRRFDITFIIPWLHTLGSVFLHTLLRIHCTFCQMYLIENSQFIAEQWVGFPSSQWCCSRGQWGGRGPLWLPAGRRIILPHSLHKNCPPPKLQKHGNWTFRSGAYWGEAKDEKKGLPFLDVRSHGSFAVSTRQGWTGR